MIRILLIFMMIVLSSKGNIYILR